ncbi:hypothetical protein O181_002646 [Austropuccinia psidii MF-1]|uniref:Uncharacterized protein n=1 Tax=Austropuccinia psidii MF-1 TaxID=1389203 RepID=A0A9Q3BCA6_9BASI|nr:hypothetical protein [Austropuccinia psidii MF-1]
MLEKGWNQRIPEDTLRKELIDIYATASSFKFILYKVKHHAKQSMNETFDYEKKKWNKIQKVPEFIGTKAAQGELSGKVEKKIPTFPIRLIKNSQPFDKELFPLRNPTPLTVPPVEQNGDKTIKTLIKERRLRSKIQREYLIGYRNPIHKDAWLAEPEILNSYNLLRRYGK